MRNLSVQLSQHRHYIHGSNHKNTHIIPSVQIERKFLREERPGQGGASSFVAPLAFSLL